MLVRPEIGAPSLHPPRMDAPIPLTYRHIIYTGWELVLSMFCQQHNKTLESDVVNLK